MSVTRNMPQAYCLYSNGAAPQNLNLPTGFNGHLPQSVNYKVGKVTNRFTKTSRAKCRSILPVIKRFAGLFKGRGVEGQRPSVKGKINCETRNRNLTA